MFLIRRIGLRENKRRTAGFNLVEIAIAIGIVGLVLGAVWAATAQILINNQVHTSAQELQMIVNNTRGALIEQGGVTDTGNGALTEALDQQKVFPLGMRQTPGLATGIIFDFWNQTVAGNLGSVFVDSDDCTGTANVTSTSEPCFGVTFLSIPQNACIILLTQTSHIGPGLQKILVNGAAAGVVGNPALPLPIVPTTSQAACNNAGGIAGTNDILWVYSVKSGGS